MARRQRNKDEASLSSYVVFSCPRCGSVRYAKEGQKTAVCFNCDYKISLGLKTRILARTTKAQEAIEVVKRHKERTQFRGRL